MKVTSPSQYHLQGGGISIAYYPDGFGPITEDRGPLHLVYQDAFRSLAFYGDEVRTVEASETYTVTPLNGTAIVGQLPG